MAGEEFIEEIRDRVALTKKEWAKKHLENGTDDWWYRMVPEDPSDGAKGMKLM